MILSKKKVYIDICVYIYVHIYFNIHTFTSRLDYNTRNLYCVTYNSDVSIDSDDLKGNHYYNNMIIMLSSMLEWVNEKCNGED